MSLKSNTPTNQKSASSVVATDASKGVLYTTTKTPAEYRKYFEQHWPLLKQGFSFPLSDSTSHDSATLFPQFGSLSTETDFVIRETTLVLALLQTIRSSNDKKGIVSAIVLYLQAHYSESLVSKVKAQLFSTEMGFESVEQDIDTLQTHSDLDAPAWVECIKESLRDWKSLRNRSNCKSVLDLVNLVVSCGMCSAASLTFSMGSMKLFAPLVSKKQISAFDIFDVVVETVIGFIEGGYVAYATGDISAFFGQADDCTAFEKSYSAIKKAQGFALTGNLEEYTDYNENDYETALETAISLGEKLLKTRNLKKDTTEYTFIISRVDRLRDYLAEFVQVRCRGGLRVSPFAMSFFGNTAVGKSTLNNIFINTVLAYNDIDFSPARIATWADNDKYASNVRSSTNAIIFDDFGNTKSGFMDFSPCYRLIQAVNNANFLAPMAEAFLKGKVAFHPWLVCVTTNVEHLLAETYSNKPESVLRRFYHTATYLKPEFIGSDGTLDSQKVFAKFGRDPCPDIWILDVRTCVVGGTTVHGSYKNQYALKPFVWEHEGKSILMEGIDVKTFLHWAQVTSKDHYARQKVLVESMRSTDDYVACPSCGFIHCNCCSPSQIPLMVEPEEQSSMRLSFLRLIFCYLWGALAGYFFSFIMLVIETGNNNLWKKFCAGAYFKWFGIGWEEHYDHDASYLNSLPEYYRRKTMFSLMQFATWQLQMRWNIRAFYWRTNAWTTDHLVELDHWYNSPIFDFIAWVPESVATNPWLVRIILMSRRREILDRKWKVFSLYAGCLLIVCLQIYNRNFFLAIVTFYCIMGGLAVIYYLEKSAIEAELLERNNTIHSYTRFLRNHLGKLLIGGLTSVIFIYRWARSTKIFPQGNLSPSNMADVVERDAEVSPWADLVIAPPPCSSKAATTHPDALVNMCAENVVSIVSDSGKSTKGFFVDSNMMLIPSHFAQEHSDDFVVKCTRRNPKVVGANFREKLSRAFSAEIPGTDFVLYWVPGGGSMKNLSEYLPAAKYIGTKAVFVLKHEDGSIERRNTALSSVRTVTHTLSSFLGSNYRLEQDTLPGMCMTPLVAQNKGAFIAGFHLCGNGRDGGSGFLLKSQYDTARASIGHVPGVVLSASMGTLPKESFGVKLIESTKVHYKSSVRFVTEEPTMEVYGTVSGMATPRSSVCPTIISDHVEEVFDVPQQWGPPQTGNGNYPFSVSLNHAAHPSLSLGSIVARASDCYFKQFEKMKKKIPEVFALAKPLTRVETVSGVSGVRFIDAMKMDTSPGWPLKGSKSKIVIDLDPLDYPESGKPRTFGPKIWDEFDKSIETLQADERIYAVWKGCLKDEPTKLNKNKVRVFQSAPLVLQLILRMYFLPIVRILQLNPLLSECAVGVNAEGLEWEQLSNHMESKGKNILAGDYGKYDLRMPAQMVISAFSILIRVAEEHCDYSEEDIKVMKAVVHEVSYPLMAYNGDLLMLFGSNPSGQNLTVIINSIVNSLLLRCCFYTIYPFCDFTDHCAFGTYGDDVKGSVDDTCPKFNHLSFAAYLAKSDIVFTMPDKTSTPTEYMLSEDADFLKRTNYYNADLGHVVGKLSEDSIFKRLHSHLLSSELTIEQQSACNIDSSLHDWFYHGREVFETRRTQLMDVATRADIFQMCDGFRNSYDHRVLMWRHKYLGEELPEAEDVVLRID